MTDPIVTVPQAPPLTRMPNIELMHTGTWPISTGTFTFTADDLTDAVTALECSAIRRPILKLGHVDPRFDGEPAVGYVDHLAVVDGGRTLVGDYAGMPGWLGDVLASAYPDRSIEGEYDHRCQMGHVHPFVVHAVALLGVAAPGIGTLESLQDVATLYGVVATSSHSGTALSIRGSSPVTETDLFSRLVAGSVSAEDVRRAFYNSPLGSGWDAWIEEIQLNPLQVIYINDKDSSRARVPVVIGEGESADAVSFGEAVPVIIRYVDAATSLPREVVRCAERTRPNASAVSSHSTVTTDGAWSRSTHVGRLKDDASAATFRKVFAWQDPDKEGKSAWKFPHHEVSTDGSPGAANTTACSAGIAALNGGRGGADIPDGDRAGVHAHLAKHLKDAGKDVPPLATAPRGSRMDDDQLTAARTALQLPDDADEATVTAAMLARITVPPASGPSLPEGTVTIDETQLKELVVAAQAGAQARAQQEQEAREALVQAAVMDGRIPPARREAWVAQLTADPGSADILAALAPGLIPVGPEIGHAGSATSADDELYAKLFGAPASSDGKSS